MHVRMHAYETRADVIVNVDAGLYVDVRYVNVDANVNAHDNDVDVTCNAAYAVQCNFLECKVLSCDAMPCRAVYCDLKAIQPLSVLAR